MRSALIALILAGVTTAGVAGVATSTPDQFRGGGGQGRQRFNQGPMLDVQGNTPYDGRYVFIRLRYSNAAEPAFAGNVDFFDRSVAAARARGGGYLSPVYVIRRR